VSRNSCLIVFVQLRNKRHKIAFNSATILTDLLLNLAGIISLLAVQFPIHQLADFLAGFYQPFGRFSR